MLPALGRRRRSCRTNAGLNLTAQARPFDSPSLAAPPLDHADISDVARTTAVIVDIKATACRISARRAAASWALLLRCLGLTYFRRRFVILANSPGLR